MHLPVATLAGGGFRSDGQELRAGMGALIRKMPEHVGHSLAQRVAQPIEDEPQAPAIRAEEIAVDQDRELRLRAIPATDVVPSWIDWPQEPAFVTSCAHGVILIASL